MRFRLSIRFQMYVLRSLMIFWGYGKRFLKFLQVGIHLFYFQKTIPGVIFEKKLNFLLSIFIFRNVDLTFDLCVSNFGNSRHSNFDFRRISFETIIFCI